MSKELIVCDNISKVYQMGSVPVHALKEVDLTVNTGEYVAILGSSGSGKSTLMNILGCLDQPSSGRYVLDGVDTHSLSMKELAHIRNQKIGFVFQGFHLLPYLSALDNVAMPLVYRKMSLKKRHELAKAMLAKVGLDKRVDHLPSELSGGQQQRVAVARALVSEPKLILADEPTGNLDSKSGEQVIKLFDELVAQGHTVMVVTHDENMAHRMPRVIRLQDGQVI